MSRFLTWLYLLFLFFAGIIVVILLGRGLEFTRRTGPPPAPKVESSAAPVSKGRNYVFWISVDGLRSDYLTPTTSPKLKQLISNAVWSQKLRPPFPSLTFPSHVTQATGALCDVHGIVSNNFYDTISKQHYDFPSDAKLLHAEPIWQTSTHQGIRTAVMDWPLSTGPQLNRPAYNNEKFDGSLKDRDRLMHLLDLWRKDDAPSNLRLLMGYVKNVDSAGHAFGPGSVQVQDAVRELDALLGDVHVQLLQQFQAVSKPGDQLYFVLTSDHGMSPVSQLVNLKALLGEAYPNLEVSHAGPLTLLTLKPDLAFTIQEQTLAQVDKCNADKAWCKVYTQQTLPAKWHFADPSRVGERILVLDKGYTFNATAATLLTPPAGGRSPGMHGYDPEAVPEMDGILMIWRFPALFKSPRDLKLVQATSVYPTICQVLGIKPAATAKEAPLQLGD